MTKKVKLHRPKVNSESLGTEKIRRIINYVDPDDLTVKELGGYCYCSYLPRHVTGFVCSVPVAFCLLKCGSDSEYSPRKHCVEIVKYMYALGRAARERKHVWCIF